MIEPNGTVERQDSWRPFRCSRRLHGYGAMALGAALGLLSMLSPAFAADTNPADFSKANQLLFMTDHMENVHAPAVLEYRLSKDDKADAFNDKVDLTVMPGKQQGKNVQVNFLSGDRHRYVPDIENAHGNPVVMMFLQHDVAELAQHTGGSWRYFQRRIKLALEHAANVTDEKADYDGRQVDVKRIYLAPFEHAEEHRNDLAEEINKHYIFTLSDQVPGGVLEMRSEIPAGKDGRKVVVESLTLKSINNDPDLANERDDAPKT